MNLLDLIAWVAVAACVIAVLGMIWALVETLR